MDDIQAPSSNTADVKIEFRGNGSEYFKIWIVNILLTIITFGIYSAWAKVRNHRYFYSNLYLDNHNFSYLAQPLTILKGRIIAIICFAAFSILSQLDPIIGLALALGLLIVAPYIVIQSLSFDRRMTAYKNIQFRFNASYGEAFMALIVWPILGMLSLGILYPLALLKMNQFVVKNSAYGTTKFDFHATYGDYGIIFLTVIGVALVMGLPIWAITFFVPSLAPIAPLLFGLVYMGLGLYFMVSTTNLFFSKLTLAEHTFGANVSMVGLAKVILINALLTLITFGLYLPAAQVRITKFYADHIQMQAKGPLDLFTAAEQQHVTAMGEELGEVFEFGV